MYKKGDVKLTKAAEDKDPYVVQPNFDARTEDYDHVGAGIAFLPHSCQEWVIGGKEQIQDLIEDLQALLKEL